MVDIHSHILPGVDDGSKSMDETLKMLKLAELDGVKTIVATPHFYRGYYENSYEDIMKLGQQVRSAAKKANIAVNIVLGQEVFLDKYILKDYKLGKVGCIEGTDYILVEFPMTVLLKDALDIIYELQVMGIRPILAHPERYKYIIDKPSKINEFLDERCLLQINTGSIKGIFGKKVKSTAEILISSGVCSFIASDAHSTTGRSPGISEALKIAAEFKSGIFEMLQSNCERLLKNQFIEFVSERIKERKSIFKFLKK
ncbi:tyrosine-protein phosphatase [Clostridium sp. BJN0013]|uniref:tyrosine-protein phosphatase n=1 Tax=Clostridium sp. BJN0013 TaxID=3236840 RepID=UPI0034C5F31A